jgi:hypothetical protein
MSRNLVDELNRSMPATAHSGLGTLLQDLITKHNAVLAKMDAAAAATVAALGTNNVATLTVTDLVTLGKTAG